jgi:hypothetical protein
MNNAARPHDRIEKRDAKLSLAMVQTAGPGVYVRTPRKIAVKA